MIILSLMLTSFIANAEKLTITSALRLNGDRYLVLAEDNMLATFTCSQKNYPSIRGGVLRIYLSEGSTTIYPNDRGEGLRMISKETASENDCFKVVKTLMKATEAKPIFLNVNSNNDSFEIQ
jgi:hypothetical protein